MKYRAKKEKKNMATNQQKKTSSPQAFRFLALLFIFAVSSIMPKVRGQQAETTTPAIGSSSSPLPTLEGIEQDGVGDDPLDVASTNRTNKQIEEEEKENVDSTETSVPPSTPQENTSTETDEETNSDNGNTSSSSSTTEAAENSTTEKTASAATAETTAASATTITTRKPQQADEAGNNNNSSSNGADNSNSSSSSSTAFHFGSYCTCDLLVGACDVNCCCDQDCSLLDKAAFRYLSTFLSLGATTVFILLSVKKLADLRYKAYIYKA